MDSVFYVPTLLFLLSLDRYVVASGRISAIPCTDGYGTGRNLRKRAGKWFSECGMFRENGGRRNGLRVPVPKWIRAGMPAVENVLNLLRTPFVSR